ncbi:zinc metalloprotease HtpX [Thioalkalivibrio nitratireducens]|nr:zinc metalloprotease HtpX [Thioalkalivibrio nitratireducens]
MDRAELSRHRLGNGVQTVLLLLGLMGLLGVIGTLIGGPWYGLVAMALVVLLYLFHPVVPPALILRLYRASRLQPRHAPALNEVLHELARRAELPSVPALYYLPIPLMNAFSVGDRREAAIALSDGLLQRLTLREIVAVLGHEVSHIAHNDLRTMTFADLSSRVTGLLSLLGLFLLAVNLPLVVLGGATISWMAIALLVFAPTLSALLQLGLARSREYQADLGAVALTGDPKGLALALARLEQAQGALWEQVLLPGRRVPEPSWLRTHPPTEQRIARLMALESRSERYPRSALAGAYDPRTLPRTGVRGPRWRIGGLWF